MMTDPTEPDSRRDERRLDIGPWRYIWANTNPVTGEKCQQFYWWTTSGDTPVNTQIQDLLARLTALEQENERLEQENRVLVDGAIDRWFDKTERTPTSEATDRCERCGNLHDPRECRAEACIGTPPHKACNGWSGMCCYGGQVFAEGQ